MNAVVGIIVLAALMFLVVSRLHSHRTGRYRRRIRPLAPRLVHRRRRHAATLQAQELARVIIQHHPDPIAHLAAGVVLQPGEDAWLRMPAKLAVRTSQPAWTAYTFVSWLSLRARNVTRETSTERWRGHGEIDWLITSQRIIGRTPVTGELISVWWSGLDGVDIDLKNERIVFNGMNGWTGVLTGPAVAPIGVAAIARCHGLEALLVHPALAALRLERALRRAWTRGAESLGTGAVIVKLPTRRPTAWRCERSSETSKPTGGTGPGELHGESR